MASPAGTPAPADDQRLRTLSAGRYTLTAELGRGGMACVYRALDVSTGRHVALKQLLPHPDENRTREARALFEREFRTLSQLTHPRMIAVYDYCVEADGPFYTMELLDGGDLRALAPMPWRKACMLIYEVASSLALLHSRHFVHRDISPRNVLCTSDGRAKLIDFGAMIPMGEAAQAVGTPAFVAPEVVQAGVVDARADLFSLGNTLYFALSGRLAYPARDFSELLETWSHKPLPPSAYVPEVPRALDALVMSLISLEAAVRPRSAFEVMQRLATLVQIDGTDALQIARAYLVTPTLVGRAETLAAFRDRLQRAQHGRGRGVMIRAARGLGRSRMLEACALDAKLLGACVLRVRAGSSHQAAFTTARALVTQLLETWPEAIAAARTAAVFDALFEAPSVAEPLAPPKLKPFECSVEQRPALQRALVKWLVELSRTRSVVVAVDDVAQADDASAALLATLAERARRHALLVLVEAESTTEAEPPLAVQVLASRCLEWTLRPLTAAETTALLGSMFGEIPNLALLAAHLHTLAAGNPHQTIELVQHLIDRGIVTYQGGGWSIPEQLDATLLPANTAAALQARIEQLSPIARRLAEAQALTTRAAYTRAEYALLAPEADSQTLEQAIDELLTRRLVTHDESGYVLASIALERVLCDGLDEPARRARHTALARLYEQGERVPFATVRHLLLGGDPERAFTRLVPLLDTVNDRTVLVDAARMTPSDLWSTLQLALTRALSMGRPARERQRLRDWMIMISVAVDEDVYNSVASEFRAQLEQDSGLADYRAAGHIEDPNARLMHALQTAAARHAATPESERTYPPDEAIRRLVAFVAVSLAIGARSLDIRLLYSLPGLLEPFVGLSPLVHAIWQNALATCESTCERQLERARVRWLEVFERLGSDSALDGALVSAIRFAVAFGIGIGEATFGLTSAERWAELLDGDPLQRVNAMYLRKVLRLQQGDFDGAERCRKQAELLSLQASSRQMFTNLLSIELLVHAAAWDLTGVKQIAARIEPLAERYAGWLPYRRIAEAHDLRLSGDLEGAARSFADCIAMTEPDPAHPERPIIAWPSCVAACVETWVSLDRASEARDLAARALAICEQRALGASANEIVRAHALAEAKLGAFERAAASLDALIARQCAAGVTGLNLGTSYEARTRVAIWAGDQPAIERFARLTAEQYRHGRGSPLGTRYERLMDEARGHGVKLLPTLSAFETKIFGHTEFGTRASLMTTVVTAMSGAADRDTRARRALQLLCEARGVQSGYLYLAGERQLRLAAATSSQLPDDMLQRLVSDFWSQLQADADPDTTMMQTGDAAGSDSQIWKDRRGSAYQPLVLSGRLNGAGVVAGLAILDAEIPANDVDAGKPLATEIASFLLHAGDSKSA